MAGMRKEERKRRAMTTERARYVRKRGHDDAKEFALLIGLSGDYQNNPQAKKDVVDLSGDTHSVKSGENKWQIFLHPHSKFERDSIFKQLNGLGQLFLDCMDVFPEKFEDYKKNKIIFKTALQKPMKKLKERLESEDTLKAFLEKSFFNAGEVTYLTIKESGSFHVFHGDDVTKVLANNITVENSRARQANQFDNQKVVFKIDGKTIGEIEMRNDSPVHFKEIKFWMQKGKTTDLLRKNVARTKKVKPKVLVYGKAIRTFRKY